MTESKLEGGKDVPLIMSKKMSIKKEIKKIDKFRVNKKFASKFKRIQVNAMQKKETTKESD